MAEKTRKVVVLYRVVQHWRGPFFDLLNKDSAINLSVWHGPDFKNSKLVSTREAFSFKRKKLLSFKLRTRSSNGEILMPISPFLFITLIFGNPDVVISEGASNLFNAIQGFVYAKLFRKKFVWWSLGKIKNRRYDSKRSKVDKIIQYIEKKSDAIISYSSRGKDYFTSIGVTEEKIFTAVNVVDTHRIIQRGQSPETKESYDAYHKKYDFVVLFVGALTKEKAVEILMQAQQKVEAHHKKIGLLIVGDGENRTHLERLARDLKLLNAEFLGKRVDDSHKFFGAADLFVLPGLGGLAISEAMCYKLPVICAIGDGCEADLVTGKNGIIDEKINPEKLATHILWFCNNKELTQKMGAYSYELIKSEYNTENYIKNIKNAISH